MDHPAHSALLKYAAISRASFSVADTVGIGVPGLTACGSIIHFTRFSTEFSTPPAKWLLDDKPSKEGPGNPVPKLAPVTPGTT